MREKSEVIPDYLIELVNLLRARLRDPAFLKRHRTEPRHFTRKRVLTFSLVMLLILQKTVKSMQRHLNEFLGQLAVGLEWKPVTARALRLARAKLRPSAFDELNAQCVLAVAYGPERQAQLELWHGHRLVGFDSSVVVLPYSERMAEGFRVVKTQNQFGPVGTDHCEGRLSVVYDLLNHIGLEARLVSSLVGEVSLAIEQLVHVHKGDVVLNDCGFTGYLYLACIRYQRKAHFVSRCSAASFGPARELFRENREGQSRVRRIVAPADQREQLQALGLPLEMVVRFVSVRLADGTLEVLVTSLLDAATYPTDEFKALYHRRWGHETFYLFLKSRLDLENWSGQSPEAVEQDCAAALLLCNLESLLSQPAQEELDQRSQHLQHPQQVNRAMSYHTLKTHLIELLAGELPAEQVVVQLQRLFVGEPVSVRPNRVAARRKPSWRRSYRFQRCKAKKVF